MQTFTALDGSKVTPRTRADLMKHPAFAGLNVDSAGNPCVWLNSYHCATCGEFGESWHDDWSAQCDDDCPVCGVAMSPESFDWLPEGGKHDEAYNLWRSLPEAGSPEADAAARKPADLPPPVALDRQSSYTITDWLEAVQVMAPGMWENDCGPKDWFAVCNDEGIIAYFGDETDAFRFRLDYINRQMNP